MKLIGVFFFWAGLLATRLDAGTGTGTSTANATVDTTGVPGSGESGAVVVSMHRAKVDVLENAGPTALVDEPLRVKAATPAILGALPQLPAWDDVSKTGGGLVADGVTPLVFRIGASGTPQAAGDRYYVSVSSKWEARGILTDPLPPKLSLPGSTVSAFDLQVTLTPANPVAYVVLNPIRSQDLVGSQATGPTVAILEVRSAVSGYKKGGMEFGVSRPPVALVHGYNIKPEDVEWGPYYEIKLGVERAPGFVIPVGYGLANGFNTTGSLKELVALLNLELHAQVRLSPALNNWAWTRYDAVGHSQGGVLLRMLCSQRDLNGGGTVADYKLTPWRAGSNFYRGRFHRVVTIGSPHAGSTLAEMGIQLQAAGEPLRFQRAARVLFGPVVAVAIKNEVKRLFQPKFQLGAAGELGILNDKLVCDPQARLHLLRTTIYGGLAPGESGSGWWPFYYSALYLNEPTPTVNGLSPGEVVAPNGADGVVDADSQEAGGGSNRTSAITGEDIIHADVPYIDDEVPDTESLTVAVKVADMLRGSQFLFFGPVTIPSLLKTTMDFRKVNIELLAQAIRASEDVATTALFTSSPPPNPPSPPAAAPPPPTGDETLHFTLQPPAGEAPNGPVVWTAVIFGPATTANSGLTLATTGTYGEQLALTVAAAVQGQVVLSVSFPSTSGQTVLGTPTLVLERPPGTALTGIFCTPAAVEGQVGAQIALVVNGTYDGTVTMPIFTNAANTTFASSNATVASVSADGRVTLAALGTAQITVTYNGTPVSTVPVIVRDVQPVVTSAASVSGSVGQTLSYQLTTLQAVQSFAGTPLPPGLTLNAQTGLISGTPTAEGRYAVILTVENANGRGSQEMEFVIAGVPGAPTDVGLDAAGVNGGKPVGTVVGRLVTVDPNPLDTFTCQLVSGAGGTDNGLFTIAGDSLVTAAVLDGAATSTVSIRVRTTDSAGASLEKALVLPVGTPPAIVRQPDARTVFAGESAILFVETTGLEPLQYQWKKDGVDVAGATSRIFEVPAAALADAGNYTVAVSNGDGSVMSAAASLVVNPISYGRWASALPSGMASALFEPGGG